MISERQAKLYCSGDIAEIENYAKAAAEPSQWDCHHRRESVYTRSGLIEIGEYYGRPPAELIFMPHAEHLRMHHDGANSPWFGRRHSAESKTKISRSLLASEHYAKRLKPVAAFKGGEPAGVFASMKEAAAALGLSLSKISLVLSGKRSHTKGYSFKQVESRT